MAKKEFTINISDELKLLRNKYQDLIKNKPMFFYHLPKDEQMKSEKEKYRNYDTTMDYLEMILDEVGRRTRVKYIEMKSFSDLLKNEKLGVKRDIKQINRFLKLEEEYKKKVESIWIGTNLSNGEKYLKHIEVKESYINEIKSIKFNISTIRSLLLKVDSGKQRSLISTLFYTHNEQVIKLLLEQKEDIYTLKRSDSGEIMIYGKKFKKVS